ncbi:MAG: hypothetical protein EOP53_24340, partial [Sphingobacteriales bacterium]
MPDKQLAVSHSDIYFTAGHKTAIEQPPAGQPNLGPEYSEIFVIFYHEVTAILNGCFAQYFADACPFIVSIVLCLCCKATITAWSTQHAQPVKNNNTADTNRVFHHTKNDSKNATLYANKAYLISKKRNLSRETLLSLKQLSSIDPQNSSKYSEEYIRINDSLQLAERKIRNKLARIEFETEELIEQKDKLVEQKESLIYFGFALLVVGIFIYVIRMQASKNRELLLIQQQQAANEEIYQLMLTQQEKSEEIRQLEKKKIGQELHDSVLGKIFGTRMSLAVLNSSQKMEDIEKRSTFIDHLKDLEQEIREISHDLNSEKTAILNNFVLMLTNFIENQKQVYGTLVHFQQDEN